MNHPFVQPGGSAPSGRAPAPRPTHGPLHRAGLARRITPFALLGLGVAIAYLVSYRDTLAAAEIAALAVTTCLIAIAVLAVPWDRLPQEAQVALPVMFMAIIVMMQVFALPSDLDVAVLLLVPLLWSALYGTSREVLGIAGAVIAVIIALQVLGSVLDRSIGLTSWTEVLSLAGTVVLLSYFTVRARSHARTDALTGVANRRAWDALLPDELDSALRHGIGVSVAIIDLDHFKQYNDTHGHMRGDEHLAACARQWSSCLRPGDTLARIGGEEFAVLLPDTGAGEARGVLQRLARAMPNGQTCSIGAAQWDGAERPEALMGRADAALYAAKAGGRDRIVLSGLEPRPARTGGRISPWSSSSTPSAG